MSAKSDKILPTKQISFVQGGKIVKSKKRRKINRRFLDVTQQKRTEYGFGLKIPRGMGINGAILYG